MADKEIIKEKEAEIVDLKQQIALLKTELEGLKEVFGKRSEKRSSTPIASDQSTLLMLQNKQIIPMPSKRLLLKHTKKVGQKHREDSHCLIIFPVEEIILEPEQDVSSLAKIGEEDLTF